MPGPDDWLKIGCHLAQAQVDACEDVLWAQGACAISVLDQHDHPLLEPPPGATPLWPHCRVEALFPAACDGAALLDLLREKLPAARDWDCTRVAGRHDWERAWMADYRPMAFGRRLWVCPAHERVDVPGAVVVHMEPGLAFGTGTHPSTALCLEWLDAEILEGAELLDVGCGSGILAIAALRLGAARAWALDNDPQALTATRDNARRNGVDSRLHLLREHEQPPHPVDLVVANILAAPLVALAPWIAARHHTDGRLALAGLLPAQRGGVEQAYAPWYDFRAPGERDGWVRLGGHRNDRD